MQSGEPEKTKLGRVCGTCGQLYEQTIAFCPKDGTRLGSELVTASSQESIIQVQITGTQPKIDSKGVAITGGKASVRESSSSSLTNPPVPPVDISGSHDSLVGKTIDDHYEILSVVGRGGMSIVYRARDVRLNKIVAIKTLLPHLVLHPLSNQRFHQEAKAARNISHQNVVTIYDFGNCEGQPYLVMDFLEGIAVTSVIQEEGKVPVQRALHIFNQVADALAHAHDKGVIHRDLKPSNILLVNHDGDPDHVKIVDFGIAKLLPQEGMDAVNLTQTGEVFGSPLYMSPEQCKGEKLDARADIYSMGCFMFETLTGKPPYPGENTLEVLYKHINEAVPSFKEAGTKLPEKLEAIVLRCLAKDPAQRYQNMRVLQEDLLKFQYALESSLLHKLKSRWQIFWLRRKPRTVREKLVFGAAVLGLLSSLILAVYICNLYLAANSALLLKQEMVWQEDPLKDEMRKLPSAEEVGVADLAIRMADSYSAEGIESKTDAINKLTTRGFEYAKREEWKLATKVYQHAYDLSVKANGETSFPTVDLKQRLADAYYHDCNWAESIKLYDSILSLQDVAYLSRLKSLYHHSEFRLGNIYYFQNQPLLAVDHYLKALRGWMKNKDSSRDFSAVMSEMMKDNLSDQTELALCYSRLGDSLVRLSQETDRDARLKSPEELQQKASGMYKQAVRAWNTLRSNPNYDGVIATAKAIEVDRQLKAWQGMDERYEQCLKEMRSVLGDRHTYVGLLLSDYAEYLWETNRWPQSLAKRLEAGNIFAKYKMTR